MATNEILQFASTDTGTNLLTQAEYAADAQRTTGNQPGIARSKLVNKSLRQSSLLAAGLAEFIADYQANNVTDSLTPQNIADYLYAAIGALFVKIDSVQALKTSGALVYSGSTLSLKKANGTQDDVTLQQPIGVGQSWSDLTSSRSLNVTYTNTTGRPILVAVMGFMSGIYQSGIDFNVNGSKVAGISQNTAGANTAVGATMSVIVPAGATYSVTTGAGSINVWSELR
jgi:hypothetical protein